ncbi:hypothetical protein [Delftia tsuruhatensis]|uniref:hypothetical protein n=1 Tax=Delftia tsuruhatensis TaxID=180282 RepID=UPI00370B3674
MRLVAVFGVVAAIAVAPVVFAQNYSAMVAKAKTAVSRDFKDPEGARFRDVGIYKSTTGKGGVSVCGEVNAKNSYGAYVGYKRFVVDDDFVQIEADGDLGLIPSLCHELVRRMK